MKISLVERRLQPMELLVLTCVESFDKKLADDLTGRLVANPLEPDEISAIWKKIEQALRNDQRLVLFAIFGIDCKKQSIDEVAKILRLSRVRVRELFRQAIHRLANYGLGYEFAYLRYDEGEVCEQIVEVLFSLKKQEKELAKMMRALSSKSGKAFDVEKHPIWDEFDAPLCKKLSKQGLMTLEDISEAQTELKVSTPEWITISTALVRYGL